MKITMKITEGLILGEGGYVPDPMRGIGFDIHLEGNRVIFHVALLRVD